MSNERTKEQGVYLKITRCDMCPFMEKVRVYTGDSFEMVFDWKCTAASLRKIGQEEDRDLPEKIPEWCPLRTAP